MFFKGTTRRKAFHVSNRVESVGGELNAYTSKEETAIHAAFMPQYLSRIVELLADVLCHATFPQHELLREREVILEEIASYRDTPTELIYDEFEDLLFSGNALGHSILGTPRMVRSFNRDSILAYTGRCYAPSRIAFCTSGPFPFKRIYALAQRLFADLPLACKASPRPPLVLAPPSCRALRRQTAQAHCLTGAIGLPLGHPRSTALALLANILGGYASTSLLNRAMREEAGLAYTVEANVVAYIDTGLISFYFGTDKSNIPRAYDLLLNVLKQLRDAPLSDLKLHLAKRQFIGQLYLGAESHETIMLSSARRTIEGLPIQTLEDAHREINAVRATHIADLANELLRPEQLSTLLYR